MTPERISGPARTRPPWTPEAALAAIDPTVPSIARVYGYLLGGKDHFPADRDFAAELLKRHPSARRVLRANRAFLARTVRHLAANGVEQFIDIGTGLPTADNVHDIAYRVNPKARVVYVDHDPLVVVHAQALLASGPRTAAVHGDLRRPDAILDHPDLRASIDFNAPVAVLLVAVLHFIGSAERPHDLVRALTCGLVPGSHLVVSHVVDRPGVRAGAALYERTGAAGHPRTAEDIAAFFAGFDLLGPGLVPVDRWHPEAGLVELGDAPILGAVGRRSKQTHM